MRTPLLALVPVAALLVAACSGGGAASAPPPPTALPSFSTRIEVSLTDVFKIEPPAMAVLAGVPVTFVVTNDGVLEHEFYLGDEAAQIEHEAEMVAMGGMAHDEPEGIGLAPGETKELTFTFAEAGAMLAGCHIAGHYAAGMKAPIIVSP